MNRSDKCTRYIRVPVELQIIVHAYQYDRAVGTYLIQQYYAVCIYQVYKKVPTSRLKAYHQ